MLKPMIESYLLAKMEGKLDFNWFIRGSSKFTSMVSKVLVKKLNPPPTPQSGGDLQPVCVADTQTRRRSDLNFTIYLPSVTNEQERRKSTGASAVGTCSPSLNASR